MASRAALAARAPTLSGPGGDSRARIRQNVSAGKIDNPRRRGSRPGDRNVVPAAGANGRGEPLYVSAGSVAGALYAPAASTVSAAVEVASVIGMCVLGSAGVSAPAAAPLYAPGGELFPPLPRSPGLL